MPLIPDYRRTFHKRGDLYVYWAPLNTEVGATSYYQFQNIDNYWYIQKGVRTGAVVVYTYTQPVKETTLTAAAGWTAKATQTYVSFLTAF